MGIERLKEFWPEWRVESELGEGAFGKVYKAVDEEAGFPVYSAVKVLGIPSSKAELDALRSEGMTERETKTYFKEVVDGFVNEIKLMHTLKGAPNVVSVEAFKIAEKLDGIGWDIFIRMELLTSFKDYINNKTLNENDAVKLGIDIASALEVCQRENIIHRDIKPANIFADKYGNFKLGDFGIAKELDKTTGAVSSKGTFSYMAPEVARGMRYDRTVDIYSLGLVIYSLLNNNRPPFVDPYKDEVGYNERRDANDRRLAGEPLPAPCNATPLLTDIILTACSYDPARRFKSAAAFKNALLNYKNSLKTFGVIHESEDKRVDINETVAVPRKPIVQPPLKRTEIKIAAYPEGNDRLSYPEVSASSNEGDTITFGHYEQENVINNSKKKIEWIILEKKNGKAFAVSKYALDCKRYNEVYTSVTWENCTLRSWLNDEFYNTAFSDEEKKRIATTYVGNDEGYTTDKVFLLSIDEVDMYFNNDEAMCCKPTKYAASHGVYESKSNDGNCWWWLRSSGSIINSAAGVSFDGGVDDYGLVVNDCYSAVRPALWMNLES